MEGRREGRSEWRDKRVGGKEKNEGGEGRQIDFNVDLLLGVDYSEGQRSWVRPVPSKGTTSLHHRGGEEDVVSQEGCGLVSAGVGNVHVFFFSSCSIECV